MRFARGHDRSLGGAALEENREEISQRARKTGATEKEAVTVREDLTPLNPPDDRVAARRRLDPDLRRCGQRCDRSTS